MAPPKSKVPQFGDWESQDDVGYTVRFDTVRKGNNPGGPMINPNDIYANQASSSPPPQKKQPKQKKPEFGDWNEQEEVPYTQYFEVQGKGNNPGGPVKNPNDIYANQVPSSNPPSQNTKSKQKQPEFGDWDEQEEVPYTQYFEVQGKGKAAPSEPQMNYNVAPTQPAKPAPSGERKADTRQGNANTRANDYNRPNNGGRGANSGGPPGVKFVEPKKTPLHPAAAGRGHGNAPAGPRQRPQSTAGPSPGRAGGGSVPVFGDWNNNPTQAEGYTVVFNKLQEDKRNGNVPTSVNQTPSRPGYSPGQSAKKQPGCMSWLFG